MHSPDLLQRIMLDVLLADILSAASLSETTPSKAEVRAMVQTLYITHHPSPITADMSPIDKDQTLSRLIGALSQS